MPEAGVEQVQDGVLHVAHVQVGAARDVAVLGPRPHPVGLVDIGSCIGGSNAFDGSLVAILAMNIAGEKAKAKVDEKNEGTGSFRAYLIDYLYKTNSKTLVNEANIKIL